MSSDNITRPYERFAEVYDEVGSDEFSIKMLNRLDTLLTEYDLTPDSALDIACGTGTLAIMLAKRGIYTVGLDISPAMLAQARSKAELEPGLPLAFMQSDMRSFVLPKQVALTTCFFDAMNYNLREVDLSNTFRCVHSALQPGGLFVFDMNSVHALRQVWGNNTFTEDFDNVTYVWQNAYEPITRTGTLTATFFVKRGELYEKFTEVHVERAYYMREVCALLEASGLTVLTVLRPNGQPADESANRHLYITRKDTDPIA